MIIFDDKSYRLLCCDGAAGLKEIEKGTVKLIYGSPPYPNAERNYGVWKEKDYIELISPFIDGAQHALSDDGFLVINVKANRSKKTASKASKRSLVVEKLAVLLEEQWGFSCVDIEIWVKGNPAPTGLRVACQDAYEQILWFSKSPKWEINIDAIRRPYSDHSLDLYKDYEYNGSKAAVPIRDYNIKEKAPILQGEMELWRREIRCKPRNRDNLYNPRAHETPFWFC